MVDIIDGFAEEMTQIYGDPFTISSISVGGFPLGKVLDHCRAVSRERYYHECHMNNISDFVDNQEVRFGDSIRFVETRLGKDGLSGHETIYFNNNLFWVVNYSGVINSPRGIVRPDTVEEVHKETLKAILASRKESMTTEVIFGGRSGWTDIYETGQFVNYNHIDEESGISLFGGREEMQWTPNYSKYPEFKDKPAQVTFKGIYSGNIFLPRE